jgi:beta-N-acetylhexosaminidase
VRQRCPLLLVALLVACLAATACDPAADVAGAGSASATAGPDGATTSPEATATAATAPPPGAAATGAATEGVTATAATALPAGCEDLPLGRRAALVLVVGMPDVTSPSDPLVDELAGLGVGGVFLTGYNVAGRQQFTDLVAALRTGAAPRPLIATDEEWGRVSSFRDLVGGTSSPRTIAATRTPAQVRAEARALGRTLAGFGVDWDFAPLADVDAGPAGGVIGDRAFAGEPAAAGRYARAFATGLDRAGVLATVKHFPGHGAVPPGIDPHAKSVPSAVSLRELRRRHLPPFERVIDAGVPVVMLNHVTYRALGRLPASMSPRAYRLLRSTGFDGVAITDSIGMGAVHRRWGFPAAAEQAIRAGADAVLATDGRQARRMRRRLVAAVRAGRLGEARLDEAVGRVLALHGDARPCTTG